MKMKLPTPTEFPWHSAEAYNYAKQADFHCTLSQAAEHKPNIRDKLLTHQKNYSLWTRRLLQG